MKQLKRISIRMRMTLLVAVITIFISVLVGVLSTMNAYTQFDVITFNAISSMENDDLADIQENFVNDTLPDRALPHQDIQSIPMQILWMLQSPSLNLETENLVTTIAGDDEGIASITIARDNFQTKMLWILAACSLLSIAAAWFLSGLMIRPLRQLDGAVGSITAKNLHGRLPVPLAADEIGGLTNSFNAMLARLENDFERQKQYSSAVAHELKTPLATIKTTLQVARLEQKIDTELYDISIRSINRLSDVVTSLLTLYQTPLEGDATKIVLKPFLTELADDVLTAYPAQRLQMSITASPADASVIAPAVLLRRLLYNVLENAVKYTPLGGSITVTCTKNNEGTSIAIADTGIGIPETDFQRIFEPFYRVENSRSRDSGGSGLGLSIVKTIAEALHYNISLVSCPENGSTFSVFVPEKKPDDA